MVPVSAVTCWWNDHLLPNMVANDIHGMIMILHGMIHSFYYLSHCTTTHDNELIGCVWWNLFNMTTWAAHTLSPFVRASIRNCPSLNLSKDKGNDLYNGLTGVDIILNLYNRSCSFNIEDSFHCISTIILPFMNNFTIAGSVNNSNSAWLVASITN